MSLKPPSLWIEQRGRHHRVYWRNGVAGLPARSYLPFYGRDAAEQFVGMAGLRGLATTRKVLDSDDPLKPPRCSRRRSPSATRQRPTFGRAPTCSSGGDPCRLG
ncbi:hypothetical protein [Blastococcus sp. SYSU DS0973]